MLVFLPFLIFGYYGVKKRKTPPMFNVMFYTAAIAPFVMAGSLITEDLLHKLLLKSAEAGSSIGSTHSWQAINSYIISDGGRNSAVLIVTILFPFYTLLVALFLKILVFIFIETFGNIRKYLA